MPVPNTVFEWVIAFGPHLSGRFAGLRLAFVIDAYAQRIVSWLASRSVHAGFVLDAPEQDLHDRKPVRHGELIHHADCGVQYVSIKYTQKLAEEGVGPSVGRVGELKRLSRKDLD